MSDLNAPEEWIASLIGNVDAWQSLISHMPDFILIVDASHHIRFLNRIVPYMTFEDVIGTTVYNHTPPDQHQMLRDALEKAFRHNVPVSWQSLSHSTQEAEQAWYETRVAPIFRNDRVEAVLLMARDITAQKQREELQNRIVCATIQAQEVERRRIAHELHDETSQSLTALLVQLGTLNGYQLPSHAAQLIEDLRHRVRRLVDDVGRLARGLHPSILDDLGLAAALKSYTTDYAQTYNIHVALFLDAYCRTTILAQSLQITMYRIVQEALTNVARHAHADTVSVIVERIGDRIRMIIEDNGIGIPQELLTSPNSTLPRGLGLNNIRERVALLHGSFEIESTPRRGSTLFLSLPIQTTPPCSQFCEMGLGKN